MENKPSSAIPGAKPASTNNPRKVEKGSLMPQFGGGHSAPDNDAGAAESGMPADEKSLAEHGNTAVESGAKSAASDAAPLPAEADGFGIDLDHLDALFKDDRPAAGANAANMTGVTNTNTANETSATNTNTANVPPTQSTPAARPLDPHSPLNRPMQKAAPSATPSTKTKHKNTFMLVCGAIAAVALLVTIGIVAALNSQAADPVAQAVNKILEGKASPNVEIHGNVDIEPDDKYAVLSHYNMKVDAQMVPSSLINSTGVKLTVSGTNVSDQTFEFSEVYAANGMIYLRASGVVNAMENIDRDLTNAANGQIRFKEEEELEAQENAENQAGSGGAETDEFSEQETSDGGETVVTNEFATGESIWSLIPEDSFLAPMMQIAQDTDNTWIQIPVGEGELATDGLIQANSEDFTDLTCKVELMWKLRNNLNTVMQLYRSNAFLSSTTEGVTLAAVNYPVRKIVINENNFISFANAANDAKLFDEYFRCTSTNIRDLYEVPKQLPEILVEVNAEHDFTRVVWSNKIKKGTLRADLGLKYPSATINVQTPSEFMTWNQVLQKEADFLNQYLEVDDTVYDEGCPACDPGAEDCVCEGTEVEQDGEVLDENNQVIENGGEAVDGGGVNVDSNY